MTPPPPDGTEPLTWSADDLSGVFVPPSAPSSSPEASDDDPLGLTALDGPADPEALDTADGEGSEDLACAECGEALDPADACSTGEHHHHCCPDECDVDAGGDADDAHHAEGESAAEVEAASGPEAQPDDDSDDDAAGSGGPEHLEPLSPGEPAGSPAPSASPNPPPPAPPSAAAPPTPTPGVGLPAAASAPTAAPAASAASGAGASAAAGSAAAGGAAQAGAAAATGGATAAATVAAGAVASGAASEGGAAATAAIAGRGLLPWLVGGGLGIGAVFFAFLIIVSVIAGTAAGHQEKASTSIANGAQGAGVARQAGDAAGTGDFICTGTVLAADTSPNPAGASPTPVVQPTIGPGGITGATPFVFPQGLAQAAKDLDIPPDYLQDYLNGAAKFGFGKAWAILAAIGSVESNHGRSTLPGVHSGTNAYGAAGPMQIGIGGAAGDTFDAYAVDGDNDGEKSVYDPADAIFTAAKYLTANSLAADVRGAIFHYNHSDAYVDEVLARAAAYNGGSDPDTSGATLDGSTEGCTAGPLVAFTGPGGIHLVEPLPAGTPVTQPFGGVNGHPGIDFGAPAGTPITAIADGTVYLVCHNVSPCDGYGNYTCILHGTAPNTFMSCYAHQTVQYVTQGQVVTAGTVIGTVGSTGLSTGAHLHFEIRLHPPATAAHGYADLGVVTDPAPYVLGADGVTAIPTGPAPTPSAAASPSPAKASPTKKPKKK